MFAGSFVALVTPFKNDRPDLAALDRLVDFHAAEGTEGIVPCGTTGEAATLSVDEYRQVVARVARRARGRLPVLAGAGSNDTARAIALGKAAAKAGADGILVVTPYYNKPPQEGLERHFTRVADAVGLPLVLYNVPSRTGVSLAPETVARLAGHKRIVGIKEASGSLDVASDILSLCRLPLLSGTDSINLPLMAVGAVGAISVVANVAPRLMRRLIQSARAGEWDAARALHFKLLPLAKVLFVESNPIPVKAALRMMGLCGDAVRLPLTPLARRHKATLRAALSRAGCLGRTTP